VDPDARTPPREQFDRRALVVRGRRRVVLPLSVAPTVPFHEPDLSPAHKAAIIAALRWAWAELKRDNAGLVQHGDEETVTEALQLFLNEQAGRARRTWLRDFGTVSRSERQRTSVGGLNKQPDLTFRPPPYATVANSTRWGWFVECKVVNGVATVTAYRDHGVRRFANGEYAAWMESGAMLAYVRDGSQPMPTLQPALHGQVGTQRFVAGLTPDRSESTHGRSTLAPPCVDVTLAHIWLAV
jgi:hypothetical protein